jgi:hypothetical protein
LVAGLPGKPQLLAQSVISGACSFVGSSTFLSRCAMIFVGAEERDEERTRKVGEAAVIRRQEGIGAPPHRCWFGEMGWGGEGEGGGRFLLWRGRWRGAEWRCCPCPWWSGPCRPPWVGSSKAHAVTRVDSVKERSTYVSARVPVRACSFVPFLMRQRRKHTRCDTSGRVF